jgi:nucleotide-binding universal stress UspA family protein
VFHIKNILFPTDFSTCAAQALDHALFLAKRFQSRLHLIHAIVLHQEDPHNPAYHFPDPEDLQEKLGKLARERMGSILEASGEHDKNLDIVIGELRGYSVADLILEYTRSCDIDMIVMGTHGKRGLDSIFLGSVAQEIVREAPCPVYTIRESRIARPPQKIDRILSPIDFSDYSRLAATVAKESAGLYDAKLQVLHVIEKITYPSFYEHSVEAYRMLEPDLPDRVRKEMRKFFNEAAGPDCDAEFHVVEGHVVHEILEFVPRNDVDLIVISTHGLSGLKHLLLGSVAEKVIHRAPCPVLTVKAFGKNPIHS